MASSRGGYQTATLIITPAALSSYLTANDSSDILYLDLEGRRLSRNGTISLITILTCPRETTAIIDIQSLGASAFTISTDDRRTLKSILEDPKIRKRAWDIRNDADALWSLFGVRIAGVTDIQLLENASRIGSKQWVHGLDKSLQRDAGLKWQEQERFLRVKREIVSEMKNDIFSMRPLSDKVVNYCVNDVKYLPKLFDVYHRKLATQAPLLMRVEDESRKRVQQACSPDYDPDSPRKREGPWLTGAQTSGSFDHYYDEDGTGYWDEVEEDDWDDSGCSAADGALFPEYLDSCWDRNS